MKKLPENFKEYDDLMSNFDHCIDSTVADHIKGKELWGWYSAYSFCGRVWWEESKWHCEIKQYGSHVATLTEETLQEIMSEACDLYGAN